MDRITDQILECVSKNPCSAKEISHYCNIPLPTVYRRLKSLSKDKMLLVSGEIEDGVRNKLFRRKL